VPVNTEIIWQIAGIGILVVVAHSVIKTAGRDELAWLITLAGVAVVLWRVVGLVNELFQAVKAVFNL
jgi:stage III sporulation protein AC